MAIQPPYAHAILAGVKTVEFRKRALASDVVTVLIYETAPTQRIVGMFTVADTVRLTPSGLWRRFGSVGSITRPDFMNYYAAHERAVGLVVGSVVRFAVPVVLGDLSPRPAVPQSFSYLPAGVLKQITSLQEAAMAEDADASTQLVSA
ncbi:ASCH domain-containing protein [Nocardioides piscis]|uniref:ASCH domain-containing protein n=1 Tax=Nocardioides piscis TaxID=2714938 RepID=UPI0019825856|nr:ASCH domain-containing protein [Nocardioides piscis]